MNRLSCALIAVAAFAAPAVAAAQLFPISREPTSWFTLGVGAFHAGEVGHGSSGSSWDFGTKTSMQYRASLEKVVRNNSSIGAVVTYVRAPILYRGTVTGANSCASCAAHLDLYGLYATFHAGGGPGFHQVVDASAGVASYQNIRRDSDGGDLEPVDAARAFSFIFGYGFGYTLSPRAQVSLVQDYGFNIHSSSGAPSGSSNTLRPANTRLTLRLGLGGGPGPRLR